VFWVDVIFWVDASVTVSIIVGDAIHGDIVDIFTIPSTFTGINWVNGNISEWTVTIDLWISFWAVFSSPSVFTIDNTLVDFTLVKDVVSVIITVHDDFIIVSWVDVIIQVDLSITISIIIVDDFIGDIVDVFTVPFSFTVLVNTIIEFIWAFTV